MNNTSQSKPNVLISACLIGCNTRYKGDSNIIPELNELMEKYNLIPVCPEQLGGLSTPRDPSEIINGRVISCNGRDVTDEFSRGAAEALHLAKLYNCSLAILKERSPSCGFGAVYDGTFTGHLVSGNGITAQLLSENGIAIIGESHCTSLGSTQTTSSSV